MNQIQASWIPSPSAFSTKNTTYSRAIVLPSRCRKVQYRFPVKDTNVATMLAMTLEMSGPSPTWKWSRFVPTVATTNTMAPTVPNMAASWIRRWNRAYSPRAKVTKWPSPRVSVTRVVVVTFETVPPSAVMPGPGRDPAWPAARPRGQPVSGARPWLPGA